MSYRQDLLKEINSFASKLVKMTVWYSSKKPFGHIGYRLGKKDYIYEFFCYLKILIDLKNNYDIEYVPNSKKFPRKPLPKLGKPYFKLKDKLTKKYLFQVCAGSQIEISTDKDYKIAPDISFQTKDSPDNPNENDVFLVMDAKYKYNPKKSKLNINDLHIFHDIINELNLKNISKVSLKFNKYIDLLSNCLITNGLGLKKKEDYCKKRSMKQIEKFDISGKYNAIG